VPVDFVAEAVVALSLETEATGRCFHLCAGRERCSTLGEITKAAASFFSLKPPRFINTNLLFTLVRPLLYATVWGKSRRFLRNAIMYRPYFQVKTLFEMTSSEEMLSRCGIQTPDVSQYLEKLFLFCRETDWGSHPPESRL
jgi:hypothetical protein